MHGNSLLAKMRHAVHTENISTLRVLELIGRLDERKSHLDGGYSSLYDYMTRGLRFSDGAAVRRIRAARAIKRFPKLRSLFIERKVSLCTVSLVSGELLRNGQAKLIDEISEKSKREVEEIMARRGAPQSPHESARPVAVRTDYRHQCQKEDKNPVNSTVTSGNGALGLTLSQRQVIEERMRISFTMKKEDFGLVEEVRRALSGKIPGRASFEDIFLLGMQELLKSRDKKRESLGSRQGSTTKTAGRHIPAAVRKAVLERDNNACSYRHQDGSVCGQTWDIELDHIKPFASGGEHSAENLRVLCREHNQHVAERAFGRDFIQEAILKRRVRSLTHLS